MTTFAQPEAEKPSKILAFLEAADTFIETRADYPLIVMLEVFIRVIAWLGLLMLISTYITPWLAVAIALLALAGVALNTWRELLTKTGEQRAIR